MKCPLPQFVIHFPEGKPDSRRVDCQKEECAWWLEDVSLCAIKELALETRYLQFRVQDMASKQRR